MRRSVTGVIGEDYPCPAKAIPVLKKHNSWSKRSYGSTRVPNTFRNDANHAG